MARHIHFLLIALILVSCSASVDPALQRKIGDYYTNAPAKPRAGSDTFERPMPFADGQYVVHGIIDGGKRSVMKTSIVGHEGDAWLIEMYTLTEAVESWTQILVRGLEGASAGSASGVDVLWVKTRQGDGSIQNVDGPVLSITKGLYRDMLGVFNVTLKNAGSGGAVQVPAGNFPHTYKIDSEARFLGRSYKSENWYHSAVPVNALVKSVSKGDGSVMELLDFGTKGATRSF